MMFKNPYAFGIGVFDDFFNKPSKDKGSDK